MKRQVQQTGIRKWYGDDFLDIQNESLTAIEAHYAPYGSCIIKGCEVSGTSIAPGIVFIDGKIQRFLGATGLTFPCYLKTSLRKETREYKTGGSKDIAEIYEAVISTTVPTGDYITITSQGGRTFRQAFQDANNRMVSDSKISEWNGSKTSAINTVRGTVTSAYDTLGKLYNWALDLFSKKVDKTSMSSSITSTSTTNVATSKAIKDAKDTAISTAASDATTKADAALAAAKTDATTKANLAKSSAISTATAEVRGEDVSSESPKFSLKKLYDWAVGKLANKPNWDSAYDQITNLQIGGRNLQQGTGLKTNAPLCVWGVVALKEIRRDENIPYVHIEIGADYTAHCAFETRGWGDYSIEQDERYIISFEARGTVSGFDYLYQMRVGGTNQSVPANTIQLYEDNWTKITIPFTSSFATDQGYLLIGVNDEAGKWFDVRNIKLEKGNKATDWTPAPEDVVFLNDFGIGANEDSDVIQISDADSATTNGTYRLLSSANNNPIPGTSCALIVSRVGAENRIEQIALSAGRFYYRYRIESIWTGWKILYHSGNFDPASKAEKNGDSTQDFNGKTLRGYGYIIAMSTGEDKVGVLYKDRVYAQTGSEQSPIGLNWARTILANPDGSLEAKNIIIKK